MFRLDCHHHGADTILINLTALTHQHADPHSPVWHLTLKRYNIQATGQDPMLIITQQIFVERETNWQ
jgi:hypothetical protein